MLDHPHKNKRYVTKSTHIIIDCAYTVASAIIDGNVVNYKIDADGSVGYIPNFIADYFMSDTAIEKVTDVPPDVLKVIADSIGSAPKRPVPEKADIDKIFNLDFTLDEIKALYEKYEGFGWYSDNYAIGFPKKRRNSSLYNCVIYRTPSAMIRIDFHDDILRAQNISGAQTIGFFEWLFQSGIDMEIRFECFPD